MIEPLRSGMNVRTLWGNTPCRREQLSSRIHGWETSENCSSVTACLHGVSITHTHTHAVYPFLYSCYPFYLPECIIIFSHFQTWSVMINPLLQVPLTLMKFWQTAQQSWDRLLNCSVKPLEYPNLQSPGTRVRCATFLAICFIWQYILMRCNGTCPQPQTNSLDLCKQNLRSNVLHCLICWL